MLLPKLVTWRSSYSPWQDIAGQAPDKTQAGHNFRMFHGRLVFAVK